MRRIEAAADAAGLSYAQMMENAGAALAERSLALLAGRHDARILFLIGTGNNGGDGLVAARLLASEFDCQVICYLLRPRDQDPLVARARTAGAEVVHATEDPGFNRLRALCAACDLLVDALLGIGLRLPLRDDVASLLKVAGAGVAARRRWRPPRIRMPEIPLAPGPEVTPPVLAVDCPSGLDCDSGAIANEGLPADETLTFIAAKPGLLRPPGALSCGRLSLADAGVRPDFPPLLDGTRVLADQELVRSLLPPRPRDGHKGTFGKLLIVGGSANYRGAPGLCALAAQRIGAGLVTVSAPAAVVNALAAQQPGVTWLPHNAATLLAAVADFDALALGPGWGTSDETRELLFRLLEEELPPLVIDADGLNLLASQPDWPDRLPPLAIITPHPGEVARLARMPLDEVQRERWQLAPQLARRWNLTLVFKGAFTIIAAADARATVLPFCSDALARAGSGDVLAGAIAGLLAQGSPPEAAAVAGAWLQGLAGLIAAEKAGSSRSPLATDLANALAPALARTETPPLAGSARWA